MNWRTFMKFWKYIWNFFIGLTMYSSFIENDSFKHSISALAKGTGCMIMFLVERILQGNFK